MIRNIARGILTTMGLQRVSPGLIRMNTRQIDNILHYASVYPLIQSVPGSIVECGVGKGRSYLYLNYLALKEGRNRIVWGFDSFEGFPIPAPQDESPRQPKQGEWSGQSVTFIEEVLVGAGMPQSWVHSNARLVKGFFKDSLEKYDGTPIALLHVDADLYDSYKEVLTALFPLVAKNGLVLFDEYNHPKWPGAKQAVDEYFEKTAYRPLQHPVSGKYYLIKN